MKSTTVKISEIFYSIQGEGIYIGQKAVFVRFFGCNLKCRWCDTFYSLRGKKFKELTVDEIVKQVEKFKCDNVVITGGEPMVQKDGLIQLVNRLTEEDKLVTIETNGTIHIDYHDVRLTDNLFLSISPKTSNSGNRRVNIELLDDMLDSFECQLKFVVSTISDLVEILKICKKLVFNRELIPVVLQPCNNDLKLLSVLINYIDKFKKYDVRLLPQLHKVLKLK